jgi:DNA replication and repair protein RecF
MVGPAPFNEPLREPSAWIERLTLTRFRSYTHATLDAGPGPVVLFGANGAGKTNLLEAVSMLSPGQGLRGATFADMARQGGAGDWAVHARIVRQGLVHVIGTGPRPSRSAAGLAAPGARTGRIVRVDGETEAGSGVLADLLEIAWLTPALDGLLTGPAAERRRYIDRLILCFDPHHRTRAGHFERAMRQRNRLLEDGSRDAVLFAGLEEIMAEAGVAIAAARCDAVKALNAVWQRRHARAPTSPFPWATAALEGTLEAELSAGRPAVDVEDDYVRALASHRERDRAAGRALTGPHRSDFHLTHGPKDTPGRFCSTGEQKALLIGLILAHAELSAARRDGAPILLLDEIAAHLDAARRAALFDELVLLGTQAWLTGTDRAAFSGLENRAAFLHVEDGRITHF